MANSNSSEPLPSARRQNIPGPDSRRDRKTMRVPSGVQRALVFAPSAAASRLGAARRVSE